MREGTSYRRACTRRTLRGTSAWRWRAAHRSQSSPTDSADGEDVEQPAVERELGAPEGSETWPSDADSGTEDDEEYNLYDAMLIEAQVFIREMCPGTCAVESLYNMILDSNPALEDMGEGEEGLTMLNAAISDVIEESLQMGYLELGGRDQQGAVTVRRTSRRVPERQERAAHAAPSGK